MSAIIYLEPSELAKNTEKYVTTNSLGYVVRMEDDDLAKSFFD